MFFTLILDQNFSQSILKPYCKFCCRLSSDFDKSAKERAMLGKYDKQIVPANSDFMDSYFGTMTARPRKSSGGIRWGSISWPFQRMHVRLGSCDFDTLFLRFPRFWYPKKRYAGYTPGGSKKDPFYAFLCNTRMMYRLNSRMRQYPPGVAWLPLPFHEGSI